MSSSEDDFMSDKFLAEPTPKPSTQTYTQRRLAAAKRHAEAQPKPRAVREEEARRKALETSLFEREGQQGGGKAMGLMMKMGWTPGEGLGRKRDAERSDKPRATSPSADDNDDDDDDDSDQAPAGAVAGIGAKRRKLSPPRAAQRTEPLRISLWAGKSGVGAHQRSPSPENMSFLLRQSAAPASTGPGKALDDSAEAFRRRRAQVDDAKRIEAREWAARTVHMELEQAKGTTFHPLWIMPSSPLTTLPRPLIRLIDPELADSLPADAPDAMQIRPGSPRGNVSAAERMREDMRRDALVELNDEEEEEEDPTPKMAKKEETEGEADVDWASYIPSVRRVLRMDVSCALGPWPLEPLAGQTITDHSSYSPCSSRSMPLRSPRTIRSRYSRSPSITWPRLTIRSAR